MSPDDPPELSPSGSPTYRHKQRTIPFQPTAGDGEVIDRVTAHIERHLGPVAQVFHEIVSDLVHIDVHIVLPTPERNCITLVTSGMSEAPMTTPDEAREYRFAEVFLHLPPDWPLGLDAPEGEKSPLADERNYWPIRLLKSVARMPHEYDTWLGYGHTLSNDQEETPYAPNTRLSSVILLPSLTAPPEFTQDEQPGRTTWYWCLYPLHADELAFKLQHGSDALIDKFSEAGVRDVIDPARPSSVGPPPPPADEPPKKRKKFFGLF